MSSKVPDQQNAVSNPDDWGQRALDEIDDVSERIDSAVRPLIEGNTESFRTVTTVSGGALVASISVAQLLSGKLSHPVLGWLLPLSWALFAFAIIGSCYGQGAITNMRSFRLRALQEFNKTYPRLDAGELNFSSFDEFWSHIRTAAGKKVDDAGKLHDITRILTSWAFVGGFIALILFAILNVSI